MVKVVQVYTQTITRIAQLMTILNSRKDSIRIINKEKIFITCFNTFCNNNPTKKN
jgi:hypothetical protein